MWLKKSRGEAFASRYVDECARFKTDGKSRLISEKKGGKGRAFTKDIVIVPLIEDKVVFKAYGDRYLAPKGLGSNITDPHHILYFVPNEMFQELTSLEGSDFEGLI